MACRIAENQPLSSLRQDLGIAKQCHSVRAHCVQGYKRVGGDYAMGIPGAALGYCQALFNPRGNPRLHTEYVRGCLERIGAPWPGSHELFWGYRRQQTADEFLSQAIQPLAGDGRVPILITGLDPGQQLGEIENIIATRPAITPGETVLVRVVLSSERSIAAIAETTGNLLRRAREDGVMPIWWPLLQGNLSVEDWKKLKRFLGEEWRYANIAVNPFLSQETLEVVWDQITVAQIPLGLADGVHDDGCITLAEGMKIMGAGEGASYNLFEFMRQLGQLSTAPTLIVLGPSLPEWPDDWNIRRLGSLVPVLKDGVEMLWADLPKDRRDVVWALEA